MAIVRLLPATLVALLFALSPVLSSPTSYNDPFRAIALQVPRQPEPEICCLTPLPPVEPTEPDVLLSFEEWKEKRSELDKARAKQKDSIRSGHAQVSSTGMGSGTSENETVPAAPEAAPTSPQELADSLPDEQVSPHFRVPLTDRFNYAGLDCSARVHMSHRSAKSPASILSHKRDRYMLSPCNTKEKQFVVVELCEDIRIDTVQLANFEFFSGVFKDFTVSVAKTYSTNGEGWMVAGTYKAKNARGVQVCLLSHYFGNCSNYLTVVSPAYIPERFLSLHKDRLPLSL